MHLRAKPEFVIYSELGDSSLETHFAGNSRNHFSVDRVTGDTVDRVTGGTVTRLTASPVTWLVFRCLSLGAKGKPKGG